jgi:hypothetical protein
MCQYDDGWCKKQEGLYCMVLVCPSLTSPPILMQGSKKEKREIAILEQQDNHHCGIQNVISLDIVGLIVGC